MSNPCGAQQIGQDAQLKQLRDVLVSALEDGTETLLDLMRDEIQRTTYGGAPGKPAWRDEQAVELREVYRVVANEVIEVGVGLPYTSYADAGYQFVRAMLIAYGSGDQVPGGEKIHSRPGELVWDDDLRTYHPSTALTEYDLPDAFNQEGNDFIANAMKLMRTHFTHLLENAAGSLPGGLFSGHVQTVSR